VSYTCTLVYMRMFVCKWEFVLCGMCALSMGPWQPRAGQLEAQSVEGVHCSVVEGLPDPQRRPNHLPLPPLWPGRAAWQGQPGIDGFAQCNPQDTAEEVEGVEG